MKWTREEITEHADQLADRFEDFDPSEAVEVPVAEYLLARAVRERDRSERGLTAAVTAALESGTSWAHIGRILGTSGREARMCYSHLQGISEPAPDRG